MYCIFINLQFWQQVFHILDCRLRLTRDDDVNATYMRIELRHNDVNIEDGEVENMWSVLLPYLRDVEQILTNFQGII